MVHHRGTMTAGWTQIRLLGRGAMGTVHLVERSDGELLAVKHPRPDIAEAVLATYRQLRTFSHPNVVGVIAIDEDREGPYIALEYVHGLSVGDLIREVTKVDEDVPASIVLRILHGAAAGLSALHAWNTPIGTGGWVHCDLSPSNILVGVDGTVHLADLDTAAPRDTSFEHRSVPTRGKPSYAPPEQLANGAVNDRSDVFALAATVGEALSRSPLFRDAVRDESAVIEVADRLAERDDVPPELVELLFEMLAPSPAHRPNSDEVRDRVAPMVERTSGPSLASYVQSFSANDRVEDTVPRLPIAVAAAATWRVKGAAIAATIDYLIQNFGEQAYGRVADHVSDRTIAILRDPVDSASWYDGRVVVELTEAAQRLYGRGPHSMARDIGAWSAERSLSAGGPYQIFRDKGLRKGIAAFVEATDDLYGLYYDHGEWTVRIQGDHEARCRLVGVKYPPAVMERIVAYLGRGIELIGGDDVVTRGTLEKNGFSIEVSWSER